MRKWVNYKLEGSNSLTTFQLPHLLYEVNSQVHVNGLGCRHDAVQLKVPLPENELKGYKQDFRRVSCLLFSFIIINRLFYNNIVHCVALDS